jgi:hypothetical protein
MHDNEIEESMNIERRITNTIIAIDNRIGELTNQLVLGGYPDATMGSDGFNFTVVPVRGQPKHEHFTSLEEVELCVRNLLFIKENNYDTICNDLEKLLTERAYPNGKIVIHYRTDIAFSIILNTEQYTSTKIDVPSIDYLKSAIEMIVIAYKQGLNYSVIKSTLDRLRFLKYADAKIAISSIDGKPVLVIDLNVNDGINRPLEFCKDLVDIDRFIDKLTRMIKSPKVVKQPDEDIYKIREAANANRFMLKNSGYPYSEVLMQSEEPIHYRVVLDNTYRDATIFDVYSVESLTACIELITEANLKNGFEWRTVRTTLGDLYSLGYTDAQLRIDNVGTAKNRVPVIKITLADKVHNFQSINALNDFISHLPSALPKDILEQNDESMDNDDGIDLMEYTAITQLATLEDLRPSALDPNIKWDNDTCLTWKSYVGPNCRSIWHSFTILQKLAIANDAQRELPIDNVIK